MCEGDGDMLRWEHVCLQSTGVGTSDSGDVMCLSRKDVREGGFTPTCEPDEGSCWCL